MASSSEAMVTVISRVDAPCGFPKGLMVHGLGQDISNNRYKDTSSNGGIVSVSVVMYVGLQGSLWSNMAISTCCWAVCCLYCQYVSRKPSSTLGASSAVSGITINHNVLETYNENYIQ